MSLKTQTSFQLLHNIENDGATTIMHKYSKKSPCEKRKFQRRKFPAGTKPFIINTAFRAG